MNRSALLVFSLIGMGLAPALGCDLCNCYSAREARVVNPGFFAGVYQQYTRFGSLRDDGREVPNEIGQYLDSSITQLLAGYQIGDRFAFQLNLPLVHRSYRRPAGVGIEEGTVSGLGDTAILARYRAFGRIRDGSAMLWNVLGGVKMPTGNSDRLLEELHETEGEGEQPSGVHGHDLTLGTGSWDGLLGTLFYAHHRRVFGEVAVQYAIRSAGRLDYRFANDLIWSVKPGAYLLMNERRTLSAQVVVSGEAKGTDTFRGESAKDTGITSVFLGPEVSGTWRHALDASFGVDFPVVLHDTSFQIVPDCRIRAAVVYRF